MKPTETPLTESPKGTEISLKDIIGFLKRNFRFVFISAFISGILGIALSFLVTKTFKAETIILPEMGNEDKKGLSSLAMGLASLGMNTGDATDAIRPDLYPSIIQSMPAMVHLLERPVMDKTGKKYATFESYLTRDSSQTFLAKIIPKSDKKEEVFPEVKKEGVVFLPREREKVVKMAREMIIASLELKSGVISMTAETDDPVVSAIILQEAVDYLTNFVTEYRTEKIQQQIDFLRTSSIKAKKEKDMAEVRLQNYRDQNRNPFLNMAKVEEQRLVESLALAQTVYNDLIQRYEQSKIKVKDEKPVFKILEPTRIPIDKAGPKRLVYGMLYAVIGTILALVYIFFYREKLHRKLFSELQSL
ncbi:Wzz/FepE/Etk N-terminal domain-containing protein [Dyadobacter tibetensis]|uniref:Wzz/FepE/Etk N-terminal domain-containing protein n=1 Tax=Dyadobacter tibetensis TaxID=1211851 RepID=UPI00046E5F0F|nr:Wzz/FepE/Etk N-terminal domain-containing protein [Dyadobacter tibetensis]